MFHVKYLCSSLYGLEGGDFLSFFLSVAMVLAGIKFFEQLWKIFMPETSTSSFIKFGQVV